MMKKMTRFIISFSRELLNETNSVSRELRMSRAEFIRISVKEKIEKIKRKKLDSELREGYISIPPLGRNVAEDSDVQGRFGPLGNMQGADHPFRK